MSKNDRRSKRTEAALLNALAELLKQKQLRKITINELVSLADLHRSTFTCTTGMSSIFISKPKIVSWQFMKM